MHREEIALQLTLKAMDHKNILCKGRTDGTYEEVTAFNAQQIADFYNAVCSKISVDGTSAVVIDPD